MGGSPTPSEVRVGPGKALPRWPQVGGNFGTKASSSVAEITCLGSRAGTRSLTSPNLCTSDSGALCTGKAASGCNRLCGLLCLKSARQKIKRYLKFVTMCEACDN